MGMGSDPFTDAIGQYSGGSKGALGILSCPIFFQFHTVFKRKINQHKRLALRSPGFAVDAAAQVWKILYPTSTMQCRTSGGCLLLWGGPNLLLEGEVFMLNNNRRLMSAPKGKDESAPQRGVSASATEGYVC